MHQDSEALMDPDAVLTIFCHTAPSDFAAFSLAQPLIWWQSDALLAQVPRASAAAERQ